jgi:hypothetical protein
MDESSAIHVSNRFVAGHSRLRRNSSSSLSRPSDWVSERRRRPFIARSVSGPVQGPRQEAGQLSSLLSDIGSHFCELVRLRGASRSGGSDGRSVEPDPKPTQPAGDRLSMDAAKRVAWISGGGCYSGSPALRRPSKKCLPPFAHLNAMSRLCVPVIV